ncbi:MAG: UvrY/SirA/GacA family response regulator transcription factor [Gammaproteobacteria bacterium]|nr:UvrY/SirA/GacA family response regulator transcription factor [Gammaproteobacteria bacterium]
MIRVLLVDDHDLVRTGIRRLLEDTEGIQVVGEARSGEEALNVAQISNPEVVLMDVNMPGMGGLEATRKLLRQKPMLKIIVVSVHMDGLVPKRLLEAGAVGYLSKGCSAEDVVLAVRTVQRGQRYISRDIAQTLALGTLAGGPNALESLSERELQVLLQITRGHSIQEIAHVLFLSPKTVSTYRSRIMKKLGVHSDVELTHLALRHGIIEPGAADGDAPRRQH